MTWARRLLWLVAAALLLVAAVVVVQALTPTAVPELTPLEAVHRRSEFRGEPMRIVGTVAGPVVADESTLRFGVADELVTVNVQFAGSHPPPLTEGRGVVVEGVWDGDLFTADEIRFEEPPSRQTPRDAVP